MICKHQGAHFPVAQVHAMLLDMLPVEVDEDEAESTYGYLCDLVEANTAEVLGEGHSNLPKIVSVLAHALTCQVMADESTTYRRCDRLLRTIHARVPAESHAALWGSVAANVRDALVASWQRAPPPTS
jgi:importin-5